MASPVDAGRVATGGPTATVSPVVDLPGSIAAGNLLVIAIRNMAGGTMTWPSGWTELFEDTSDSSNDTTGIGYRVADGTEGATVTLTNLFGTSGRFAALAWRITGNANPATQAPQTAVAVGTTVNPDAPSISPTGGSKDYLFLAFTGWDGESFLMNADPSGYGNTMAADSGTAGGAATNGAIRGLSRQATTASENPSAWTLDAAPNAGWTAVIVAIHPATALPSDDTEVMAAGGCLRAAGIALFNFATAVAFTTQLAAGFQFPNDVAQVPPLESSHDEPAGGAINAALLASRGYSISTEYQSQLAAGFIYNDAPVPQQTTRMYPSVSGAIAPVLPAFDAAWTHTAQGFRRTFWLHRDGDINSGVDLSESHGAVSADSAALGFQFVSPPLRAGLYFSTTDRIKYQMQVWETTAASNINRNPLVLKVVSEDGNTIRAVLKNFGHHGPTTTEWPTTNTNRTYADGDFLDANYGPTLAGDRLVLEVGAQVDGTGTADFAFHHTLHARNDFSDLPEDQTDTGNKNTWFEITRALEFRVFEDQAAPRLIIMDVDNPPIIVQPDPGFAFPVVDEDYHQPFIKSWWWENRTEIITDTDVVAPAVTSPVEYDDLPQLVVHDLQNKIWLPTDVDVFQQGVSPEDDWAAPVIQDVQNRVWLPPDSETTIPFITVDEDYWLPQTPQDIQNKVWLPTPDDEVVAEEEVFPALDDSVGLRLVVFEPDLQITIIEPSAFVFEEVVVTAPPAEDYWFTPPIIWPWDNVQHHPVTPDQIASGPPVEDYWWCNPTIWQVDNTRFIPVPVDELVEQPPVVQALDDGTWFRAPTIWSWENTGYYPVSLEQIASGALTEDYWYRNPVVWQVDNTRYLPIPEDQKVTQPTTVPPDDTVGYKLITGLDWNPPLIISPTNFTDTEFEEPPVEEGLLQDGGQAVALGPELWWTWDRVFGDDLNQISTPTQNRTEYDLPVFPRPVIWGYIKLFEDTNEFPRIQANEDSQPPFPVSIQWTSPPRLILDTDVTVPQSAPFALDVWQPPVQHETWYPRLIIDDSDVVVTTPPTIAHEDEWWPQATQIHPTNSRYIPDDSDVIPQLTQEEGDQPVFPAPIWSYPVPWIAQVDEFVLPLSSIPPADESGPWPAPKLWPTFTWLPEDQDSRGAAPSTVEVVATVTGVASLEVIVHGIAYVLPAISGEGTVAVGGTTLPPAEGAPDPCPDLDTVFTPEPDPTEPTFTGESCPSTNFTREECP